jgi:large repetitive protein
LRRVLAVFALLATLIWFVSENSTRAEAQQQASGPPASSTPTKPVSPVIIASGAQYANVRGLATDTAGGLYISLSATPSPKNCVTSNLSLPSGSTTKVTLNVFSNCTLAPSEDPSGITVAPSNKVYLANRSQNTIRLLDMLTGNVATIPLGSASGAGKSASNNLDPYQPAGLASDTQGNLYVADRGNNRVLGLTPNAAHFTYLAHVLDADAVAVYASGAQLYVASPASNRVFLVDLNTGDVDVFAGSGAFTDAGVDANSSAEFNSTPGSAQLGAPEGVAVDGQGNVFISDTGANALVRVNAKSGTLSRVDIQGSLNSPGALAIDRAGNVFLADRGDQHVLEFPHLGAQAPDPAVTLLPSSFNFGDEPTGGTTPAQAFTLTNNSSTPLSLATTSFTFAGADPLDFTETNDCVPSLSVNASCQINVTFTPGGAGTRTGTLQVTDSDPSSPQTAGLSGTGDDFELTVPNTTDTTASVAQGFSATYEVYVTPDNTFSGTVTLLCPAALSAKTTTITCSIRPATLNITPGQAQPFYVTLTTAGPNATRMFPLGQRSGPKLPVHFLLLFVFAVMMMLLIALRLRRETMLRFGAKSVRRTRFAVIFLALLAGVAAAGCNHSGSVNPSETPEGSYPVVITGTAQNAGRSITLTLNVT